MAWLPPPPLSLDLSSPSDLVDDPPRRPSSAEFLKTAKERLQQQQQHHPPLSTSSSSMLQSPSNVNNGTTPISEKRESAPPAFRTPSSSSILSTSDNGLDNNNNNGEPSKQRPRSGSHAQIHLYSQSSALRPLPALPKTSSRRASAPLIPDYSIKVPVDDDGSLPSPHVPNSDRLHPNGYVPKSPHFRPQEMGTGPPHHYTTLNQGYEAPFGTNQGRHVLEHQSSMSSNGSGSNKSRLSMSSLRQTSDPRGDSALDSGQTQEQVYRQGQGYGGSFGEGYHLPSFQQQHHQQQHPQRLSASFTRDGNSNGTADERSIQQQHLKNLLQDEATAKPHRTASPLASPAVSSSATPSMISLHPSPRLPILDVSSSVSSSATSPSYSPIESATSRKLLKPTPTTTPHLSSQPLPISNGLQPYYPPPPALSTNTRSNHPTESASFSPHLSTHSTERMSVSPANTLNTTRSRRHSSSGNTLSIQTQHLDSFRKGPSTADTGEGPLGRKNLKNNLASLSPSKQSSPSASSAQLVPRQSPNHLGIPSSSPHLKPGQGSSSQGHSQHAHQQAQQQHRHHPPPAPSSQHQQRQHLSHQHHDQLQQQHSSQRSQYHQQHQHPPSSQNSTVHSSNSPRPTSPLSSGVLDAFQDRTAMALMQRYLTSPDDPESEADIQMQIMISQAAVDSKGFEVLVPQSVESVKRHHATLSSRIAALTARLSLESKIREAAQSLLKLHADNKKLARQASDHLEAANRKVDQVATELWKLTQLAADLQRTLLQHTSGVLALGVVRLEDQSRREREVYALQLQEARVGKDVEDQFESMSRTIMSLESDTLEAQLLLEDKDRTIERLMKQLDHQRDLYVRLDEQQQKMMALSHSQQKDLDLLDKSRNDAKTVAELESLLSKVVGSLQGILQQQQQQQQQYRHQKQLSTATTTTGRTKIDAIDNNNNNNSNSEDHQHKHRKDYNKRDRSDQTWSSDSTLLSKRSSPTTQDLSVKTGPACEDSMSSSTQDSNISDRTANSAQGSTLANDKSDDIAEAALQHVSRERIFSTLDALDRFMTESQQKSQILEDELGLLRRQSVVLSESRNNSIKIKNFSSMRGQAAEETIRSALEKSLKDALLEKEIARQELENERQRWQDDQNHRISALEESLVAVEDNEKSALDAAGTDGDLTTQEDIILTLRVQLQEAIDEIDTLSQQQQSSLKSMRQLFALIPDSRRKSNLQSGSISSMSSGNVTVGFSMETLILRIKELVARSQQLEQDSSESKHPRNSQSTTSSRQTSHQGAAPSLSSQADAIDNQQQQDSTWVSNSELERLQANAGMIQLLEKEIELLKQHTDMLLDENARLAEMAAASATAVSHTPSRSSADLRAMIRPPSIEDALDELHEIIRVKDILLRERDLLVEQQEKALLKVRAELAQATEQQTRAAVTPQAHATSGVSPGSPLPPLSSFDVAALEDFRVQCDKLEEQNGEMRMIIAALEVTHGGPGSGAQLLKALQSANTPSSSNSTTTSWLSSRLGAAGSLSFGSLTQKLSPEPTTSSSAINTPIPSSVDAFSNNNAQFSQHQQQQSVTGTLSGGSNAAITSATAALRKEFRRVMAELREEKEKAVRKEVEERRRLERTVRQLRRELQAVQNSEMTTA